MSYPEYWTNPLRAESEFTVVSCTKTAAGFEVGVKENAARPEGGGQAGDRGVAVVDGKEIIVEGVVDRGGIVTLIAQSPISQGTRGLLRLDAEWRRSMMRTHSSEHLFVAALKTIRPALTMGYIWIDGQHGTVEILGESVSLEDVLAAEAEVQRIIYADVQSTSSIVAVSELDDKVRARDGVKTKHEKVRVISFGRVDSSACSGTHVLHTGDIGCFKVIDFRKSEQGTKIEFVAGHPAARLCSDVFNAVMRRKNDYPFEYEQLGAVIDKSKEISDQYGLLLEAAEDMLVRHLTYENIGNVSFAHEYLPGFDPARVRNLTKKLPLSGRAAVLLYIPGNKPNFTFVTNQFTKAAREYIDEAVIKMGGRGGGAKDVYTGGFSSSDDSKERYTALVDALRQRLSKD